MTDPGAPTASPRGAPPLALPLIVAAALFMETMEATAISTSLPQIARDLGESPVSLKLALTTYMIGVAMCIPASAWAADRFGSRSVFRAAIAVFAAGSVACALAPSLLALVAARFVQAVGGAMMVPVGRMVLLRTVPREHLVRTLSYLAMPGMLGPIVGPAVGGLITTYGHWRAIFLVNLPLALLALWLARRHLPQLTEPQRAPFDGTGFVLAAIALGATTTGLAGIGQSLLSPALAGSLIAVGLGAAAGYGQHWRRRANAVLDLSLLGIPTFAAGVVGGGLFRFGIGATPFLLSLMFQLVWGLDAARTGLLLMVGAVAALSTKTVAVATVRRVGFRALLLWNGALAALLIGACGLLAPGTPLPAVLAVLFAGGAFRSLQFTALHSISYADVPAPRLGAATALASVTQQLSLSLGVTIAAQALSLAQLQAARAAPAQADFAAAFAVVAACSMLSLAWAWRLDAAAGAELAGRERAPG